MDRGERRARKEVGGKCIEISVVDNLQEAI